MRASDDRLLQSQPFLDRLASGDEQAFEMVFRTCYGRVFGLACRVLGSSERADDVAQEVFLRLYRHPLPPGRQHNLLAWLLRVTTNLCYNVLREERRRRAREERAHREDDEGRAVPGPAADGAREERVRQTLLSLPQRQAQLLLLRHAGLSYAEMAHEIGVAPGSVGTLLARAERSFQELYYQLEEQEEDVERI